MSKRGIVCCFCGEAWGYEEEEPTQELIKQAVDHEKICPQNPYLARIKELEQKIEEYETKGGIGQCVGCDSRDEAIKELEERLNKEIK